MFIRQHLKVTEGKEPFDIQIKAIPIKHVYNTETGYSKDICPVCFTCNWHTALSFKDDNCPCCNVAITWGDKL